MNLILEMNLYEKGLRIGKVENLKLIKSETKIRAEFELKNEISNTTSKFICFTKNYEKLKNKIVENEILIIKFEKFEEKTIDLNKEMFSIKHYLFVKDVMIINDEIMKTIFN